MIIAAIAYQEFSENQKQSITEIFISHPEYNRKWKEDYEQVIDDVELGLYLLMRASMWPDNIRSNKHPDHSLNASRWHYMNYELRFPYGGEVKVADQENVLDAIDLNLNIFNDLMLHLINELLPYVG